MSADVGPDQRWSACYAPHSAWYFQPDGEVRACCSSQHPLGSVTGPDRATLREIWTGEATTRQRAALERDDFSFGCEECALRIGGGGRRAALAYWFDRFADGAPHEYPKLMDMALSNRCNLQCVMCNGSLSSTIRAKREHLPPLPSAYDDQFFDELDEFLPHVERFQFKGGEPFLAPENRRIWDRLIDLDLQPEITVTTNGTIFDHKVEHYLRTLRMQPNLSVDAMTPALLESIRVGVDATRFWNHVDQIQAITDDTGQTLTLSLCLMANNWRELLPFLREADRRLVNCNVIVVTWPPRFSILGLHPDDLASIHHQLTTLDPSFATSEPRRAWDEVLTQIASQIEVPIPLHGRAANAAILHSEPDHLAPELSPLAWLPFPTHLDDAIDLAPVEDADAIIELDLEGTMHVQRGIQAGPISLEGLEGEHVGTLMSRFSDRYGPSYNWVADPRWSPDDDDRYRVHLRSPEDPSGELLAISTARRHGDGTLAGATVALVWVPSEPPPDEAPGAVTTP